MKTNYFLSLLITLSLFTFTGYSQISQGGTPLSFSSNILSESFEVIDLPAPDITQFQAEDEDNDKNNFPQRIATNVPVFINIHNSGNWENLKTGGRIWRVKFICEGALALNVQFDQFYLPDGGQLFLYNHDKTQILGAYTTVNNNESGIFSTELIEGDEITIEYYEPEKITELVELSISDIAYAYRNVSYVFQNTEDFGDSEWCEVNVNCSPEGDNWQDEKRGVARILFKDGAWWYWCTGSLINNTLVNGTPYFLTADHCGGTASASDRNQWIFYFNFESSGCSNPGSSPGYNSIYGATLKSRGDIDGGSDFQLVQLNSTPPSYYNVYYNGWDRSGSSSSSGVAIHHPAGDIKKISTYNSTLTSATWNGSGHIGATNAHWRAYWIATTNGHGVNEGGSSGSPIFNNSGRVLGTLTGGSSSCSHPTWPDLYGKFSYHWQSNGTSSSVQLKPWLDPNNSGVTYLNGYDPNAANPPVADFIADNTSPAVGQTVNFTDLSTNSPTSWSWSFTPSTITYVGGTNQYSQNPQVEFSATGLYTVSLIATNAGGSDTETKTDYINVPSGGYCFASGGENYPHISGVQFGTINNTSGQNYYADYTSLSTNITRNQSYDITVTNGYVHPDNDLSVWIDWNQDDDFDDSGENVVCEISNGGQGTYSITVPGTALLGTTRMRIRTKHTGDDCGSPCGTTTYGEVEDYSVNIIESIDPPVADFSADDTSPGIGQTVNFTDLSTNSPTSWSWTFTPSTVTYVGSTTSGSQNPQVQFDSAGDYTVELTATNAGGSDTETKTDYISVPNPEIDVDIIVFLEGPFNGTSMDTDLNPFLPLSQPFNTFPWNYTGTESVAVIPGTDIVEWILIGLRDAVSAGQATSGTIIDRQAAFLRNDGRVVNIEGNPVLNYTATFSDSLFVVVHQRNHLSVISATGLTQAGGVYTYNFSTGVGQAHGGASAHNEIAPGIWGMAGGDGDRNGQVGITDKSPLWENEAGIRGYLPSDYNLDSESNNKDKNDVWLPNNGMGSQVP
ncbi:MAG: PKD domain-containing protein [Bacteroidales bacterium]|nr:PKD domain-containing protein [Bacteroidales bacterium]